MGTSQIVAVLGATLVLSAASHAPAASTPGGGAAAPAPAHASAADVAGTHRAIGGDVARNADGRIKPQLTAKECTDLGGETVDAVQLCKDAGTQTVCKTVDSQGVTHYACLTK